MELTKVTYRSSFTDEVVDLICPWPDDFDMTPPATLIFHREQKNVRFFLCSREVLKICS